jgi:hypothetical protein
MEKSYAAAIENTILMSLTQNKVLLVLLQG